MSETKFMPGPWHACQDGKCKCKQVWSVPADCPVCVVESGPTGDEYPVIKEIDGKQEARMEIIEYWNIKEETAIANINLIAAAPDLYAALENLINFQIEYESNTGGDKMPGNEYYSLKLTDIIVKVANVLQKARGQS